MWSLKPYPQTIEYVEKRNTRGILWFTGSQERLDCIGGDLNLPTFTEVKRNDIAYVMWNFDYLSPSCYFDRANGSTQEIVGYNLNIDLGTNRLAKVGFVGTIQTRRCILVLAPRQFISWAHVLYTVSIHQSLPPVLPLAYSIQYGAPHTNNLAVPYRAHCVAPVVDDRYEARAYVRFFVVQYKGYLLENK